MVDLFDKKTIVIELPGEGENAERNVTVAYDKENVQIKWLCGGEFVFTKTYLAQALEAFEASQVVPEVFYEDSADIAPRDGKFFARLIEKNFAADNHIFATTMGVPWDSFKAALVEATTNKKSRKLARFRK